MICKFCQKETKHVLSSFVCQNHLPVFIVHAEARSEYYFFIEFQDKTYKMRWFIINDEPIFELLDGLGNHSIQLLMLDHHPSITPEQATTKLKTWLLFI